MHPTNPSIQGRTHMSGPEAFDDDETVWEHPLRFVLAARSHQRWPSLVLKVGLCLSMPYQVHAVTPTARTGATCIYTSTHTVCNHPSMHACN